MYSACVLYALHAHRESILSRWWDLERGEKNEWILLALASKCDQYGRTHEIAKMNNEWQNAAKKRYNARTRTHAQAHSKM